MYVERYVDLVSDFELFVCKNAKWNQGDPLWN